MVNTQENFPYNLEAEQTVLGCILIDADLQLDILLDLKKDDFFVETHKIIFEAMKEIVNDNKPIDNITLVDIMEKRGTLDKIGGISYLTGLITGVPSSSNYKYYLDIVKRDSILRKLIKVGSDILQDAKSSSNGFASLEKAENGVYGISEENDNGTLVNLAPSYSPVLDVFAKIGEDKNYLQGLMTGFVKLDALTNGFKGGQLIILAAR
ncbi:MAG TPA: replicative DNA helicase, partial [Clostridiales bacterium]|nr:replicative DNA helicase [Clostridiales bacterium]